MGDQLAGRRVKAGRFVTAACPPSLNVLTLQRMLGHKSVKVTLDTYADLFDTDLVAVTLIRLTHSQWAKRGHRVSRPLGSEHRKAPHLR